MIQRSAFLAWVCALACSSSVWAQRQLTDIPVPDPEVERKSFVIADGFEVNLFAADPLIHKPIQINFDPQGRLWVAASEVYPQIAPGQTANDKILILEDTDVDGVADKTTVFAEGLLIPTGVVPGDGGAYVANSTELLHLSDTDGDGKADKRRIVLSGFGTEDTHHIIHTFRWGPDGLFYMNQSIYIHSHVETPFGVKRLNAGGIWQFRPSTLQLDVLARGWVNAWGHAFDRWGQSFVTDGAGGEGINYLVPGAAYPTAFGASEILHGLNPGSPKYCGLALVDGRHLPEDWQGNLITHDFRGHRVCRFVVADQGSGFQSIQQPDLISTKHVAFRPIDVQQGPDGAIYIADWYNPIIQHGEVDFRDPRRDHVHGRIWRVTAKNRPLVPRPKLVEATNTELLQSLLAPEDFTRQQARRVLQERPAETILPAVQQWLSETGTNHPQRAAIELEALWLYQAFDIVNSDLLQTALKSSEPRARAAAVRVFAQWASRLENPEQYLTAAVHDEYARVRLEAVRALATIPTVRSAELAFAVVDHPMDGFLDYALRQTARELKPVWLPAAIAGTIQTEGQLPRLLFAMQAVQASEIVPQLVRNLEDGSVPAENRGRVLELIGSLGAPQHLRLVFDRALTAETPAEEIKELLAALRSAQIRRNVRPAGDLQAIVTLMRTPQADVREQAIACIQAWKLAAALPQLQAVVQSDSATDSLKTSAIGAITAIAGPEAQTTLQQVIQSGTSEAVAAAALAGLTTRDPSTAAALAVTWLRKSKSTDHPQTVINAFLQQKEGAELLAAALNGQQVPPDAAKLALRAVTGSGRPEPKLIAALQAAGGIKNEAVELTPAEMAELVAEIQQHGDPVRGEAIYRRNELSCLKCHAIGGAGGKVGPDLVSIGSSAPLDYLVDSLLAPNKKVKEGYQTAVVVTDAGKVLTGIKVRQSDQALILRDAEDRELSIPLNTIDEEVSGSSLMPAGLTDKLTRDELRDLARFLSELGKPGPFAVQPTRQPARVWKSLQPNEGSYRRLTRTSDAQLMADDADLEWRAIFSTVAGELPLSELPVFEPKIGLTQSARRVAFVRTGIDVSTAEEFQLVWNDVRGLQIWIDGQPRETTQTMPCRLTPGRHSLSVAIDLQQRMVPLAVELVPISAGKWSLP